MIRFVVFVAPLFLSGCVPLVLNIPDFTPIHEDGITVVSDNVNIGSQVVYKDQILKPYIIDGKKIYCSDLYSMNLETYRCFSGESQVLTKGMHPTKFTFHDISPAINIKTIQKSL